MFVGGRTGSDFTEYCFLIWLFAHLYVATVGNHVLYHQKEMNSPWNMKRYNFNLIKDFLLGLSVNDVTHFLIFLTPPPRFPISGWHHLWMAPQMVAYEMQIKILLCKFTPYGDTFNPSTYSYALTCGMKTQRCLSRLQLHR